ncbi:hypothetical protein ADL05_25960 [Nocardiopsis sp. NRRL B-16309]|nr:hypothetical protein ADL05_25960 [Nocardiopsis sp. NRRL B-16309]
MRQAARRATVATRKAASAAHRDGLHTIASHLRQMGADEKTATAIAATLRKKVTPGIRGFALKDGVRRSCTRYTRGQILAALVVYKPRSDANKAFRTLALAA